MTSKYICAVAAAVLLFGQPAMAAPLVLAPTDEWRLLRNEASCELIRRFGTGDEAITLLLELSGPEAHFSFSAFGKPFQRVGAKQVELRFGPDEKSTRRSYMFGKDGRGNPFLIMHGVRLAPPSTEPEIEGETGWLGAKREAAITQLELSGALPRPITLELGRMDEQLRQIRTCGEELSDRLENGPFAVGFSRRPVPTNSPGEWIGSDDYPPGLVWNDIEGVVSFRIVVSSKGKPIGCHIKSATTSDAFNDSVCYSLIRRAQFESALDGQGNPVAAYYDGTVRFVTD